MKKILVFGVFDKFHEGHKHFLNQAKAHGDKLVVVVARDEVVRKLKGKMPDWKQDARMEHIRAFDPDAVVVLGDSEPSSYTVLKTHEPDVVCLGYDQSALRHDLEVYMKKGEIAQVKITELKPHKPELYKSSKIAHAGTEES